MKQKILIDIGGDLEYKHYENSLQAIPSSGTIVIYDSEGTEKVAETAISIDASGTMTYAIGASIVDEIAINWRADWKFVVSSITIRKTQLFNIVNFLITNPVIDQNIIDRYPFVKDMNYRVALTADSGTTATIVCDELTEDDDYWNGGTVEITAGTNQGEKRSVSDFVASSNTVSVADVFGSAIDATSKFILIRTFKKEIDEAFKKFEQNMKTRGIDINKIVDNTQIFEYILVLSIHFICSNFTKDPTDIWFEKAAEYKKEYAGMLTSAVFDYDDDDDGNVEPGEESTAFGQLKGVR